jgi:hypothetical protein
LLIGAVSTIPTEDVYLFIDEGVVRDRHNWRVVVPPVEKSKANPLMVEDKVWEVRWDNTYATTMWDEDRQLFRMWYGSCLSCDRLPKPTDGKPNTVDGCGHPTWHHQFPQQTPWQTPQTISGVLYAESADGLHWKKPNFELVTYGAPPPPPPACIVGSLGGGDMYGANMTVNQATAYCANSSTCAGFTAEFPAVAEDGAAAVGGAAGACPDNATTVLEFHFKDEYGTKRLDGGAKTWRAWQWVPKSTGGVVNTTNILAAGAGGTGIVYDERDHNASRRYKMFGGMHWELCMCLRVFDKKFTLVDGILHGCSLPLPVGTVNSFQTLKARIDRHRMLQWTGRCGRCRV